MQNRAFWLFRKGNIGVFQTEDGVKLGQSI
jgi:hypothetical protein